MADVDQRQQQQQQRPAAQQEPPSSATASVTAEARRKHMMEEWFHLYENFQQFQQQDPTQHPLFQIAVNNLQKNQSLNYHRGVYDTLVRIMRLFPVAKEAEREQMKAQGLQPPPVDAPPQMWEVTITDVLRIQIGYTIGAMLKIWPADAVPNVRNAPMPTRRRKGGAQRAAAPQPDVVAAPDHQPLLDSATTTADADEMYNDDSADDAPQ